MEAESKEALLPGNFLDVRIPVLLCLFLFNILVSFFFLAVLLLNPLQPPLGAFRGFICQEPKLVFAAS